MRLGCPHCAHAQWRERAAPILRRFGAGFGRSSPVFRVLWLPAEAVQELGISWKAKGGEGEQGGWQVGEGHGSGLHLPRCPGRAAGDRVRSPPEELLLGRHLPACTYTYILQAGCCHEFPGSRSSAGSSLPSAVALSGGSGENHSGL